VITAEEAMGAPTTPIELQQVLESSRQLHRPPRPVTAQPLPVTPRPRAGVEPQHISSLEDL
jgi:hypothetical protein